MEAQAIGTSARKFLASVSQRYIASHAEAQRKIVELVCFYPQHPA
jgi:hypothetical protein